jgi:2'-5' RNA ligase
MKLPSRLYSSAKDGYAVELSFDPRTDAIVRRVWDELARESVNDFMAGFGVHPHVSLAVFDELLVDEADPEIADLAHRLVPMPVVMSSIGVFSGSGGVVFFGVVVTDELLTAHAELHRRLHPLSRGAWAIYERSEWVPHCTLTKDMPADRISRAIEIARRAPLPLRGTLDRVNLVKFRPPEDIFSSALG